MEVRRLTVADYEEITTLWNRACLPFKTEGRDGKEAIRSQMQANPDFFLGAFEGNRLVGTVIVSSDMRRGWINRLAVDPDCRCRGVAKVLLVSSEKTLRTRGLRIFCSLIDDSNKASKALFKKCGYIEHCNISYFSKRDSNEV